ncbi:hypothetical protein BURK_001725 [Burkholderia sp. SJ98]|nr:hypothetical protein BURK_001725 [Burkholderia sp. SJ98]
MERKEPPSPSAALSYAHLLGLPKSITKSAVSIPQKVASVARATRQTVVSKIKARSTSATPFADLLREAEQRVQRDASDEAITKAVAAERARCGEILAAGLSLNLTAYASHLASKTGLTVAQAVSILHAADKDRANRIANATPEPLIGMQRYETRIQWHIDQGLIK